MSVVKKTAEYKIIKRRDNRYAVESAAGKPINGDEKVAILQQEGFLKKPDPRPEPVAEEDTAEEGAEGSAEEGSDEAAGEESKE